MTSKKTKIITEKKVRTELKKEIIIQGVGFDNDDLESDEKKELVKRLDENDAQLGYTEDKHK